MARGTAALSPQQSLIVGALKSLAIFFDSAISSAVISAVSLSTHLCPILSSGDQATNDGQIIRSLLFIIFIVPRLGVSAQWRNPHLGML